MQTIIITNNDQNKRIDKFLCSFYNLPQKVVMQYFRKKDVRVNGIKSNQFNYLLQIGDEITTYFKVISKIKKDFLRLEKEFIKIYEDENILIVEKPENLAMNSKKNNNLVDQVLTYLEQTHKIKKESSFIPANIHQLDKATTGLVIFALNYPTLRSLQEAMVLGQKIIKKYKAYVHGVIIKKFILETKLIKNIEDKKMMVSKNKGKNAISIFKPLKQFEKSTLVEIEIITGRKHQIRVQLSHVKYPIYGDKKYGIKDCYHFLHLQAYQICFQDFIGKLAYLNNQVFKLPLPKK